jgi:hypothetical protein
LNKTTKKDGAQRVTDVEAFTDGACLGNPGPGGWAALLRSKDTERLLSGGEAQTTNNRMELHGSDSGARSTQATLSGDGDHRFALRDAGHRRMGAALDPTAGAPPTKSR